MRGSSMVIAQVRPASCMPSSCFCEAIRSKPPLQPANSWSSLAFVAVAVAVIAVALRDRSARRSQPQNLLSLSLAYPLVYALALVMIGIGSAAFHAELTVKTQFADVFGMYLIATFILLFNIQRLRPIPVAALVVGYLVLNGALAELLDTFPEARRYAFAVVLLAALGLEWRYRNTRTVVSNGRLLGAAVASLAIGFVIWIADITRVACSPISWLQGHAVWHLLGALGALFLFLYYRSERYGQA
ncbi:MAG: ceramidase domain-containing protein [Gemmatimonadaceae bacterium]